MFIAALIIGILAYAILGAGLLGILYPWVLCLLGLAFLGFVIFYTVKHWSQLRTFILDLKPETTLDYFLMLMLLVFALIHLMGVLAPEIFFDALWYHLTLPKLYLAKHTFSFIPGDLYYYSAMPQLGEMLYTLGLVIGGQLGARLWHFLFGILTTLAIYIFGSKHLSKRAGLVAALLFISDLAVAWLITTAYIDLARTFFEFLAFFYFYNWYQERRDSDLFKSSLLIGLGVATKYFGLVSLGIIGFLVLISATKKRVAKTFLVVGPALLISSIWFVRAYLLTGYPFYPLFSGILSSWHDFILYGPWEYLTDFFKLSNLPTDWISPISPLYIALLPFSLCVLRAQKKWRIIAWYCLLAYTAWFLIPRTGGSRFMVPYLPAFALLASLPFAVSKQLSKTWQSLILALILAVVGFNGLLRVYINAKTLPLILGQKTSHQYLLENLDLTNAFYDTDDFLAKTIKDSDLVCFEGGQNLFYVDFPYVHESYQTNEVCDYVLVQYQDLDSKYENRVKFIYENQKNHIKLYKLTK
ncbi:phospholipid carrier-dependent glycosyltransferase [Candidatus Beckwithbacteria bacterium]|nr:phospholipid carrier-dependent glycosyltransferase [Candidatus Beckwithbacteria bacterium]